MRVMHDARQCDAMHGKHWSCCIDGIIIETLHQRETANACVLQIMGARALLERLAVTFYMVTFMSGVGQQMQLDVCDVAHRP